MSFSGMPSYGPRQGVSPSPPMLFLALENNNNSSNQVHCETLNLSPVQDKRCFVLDVGSHLKYNFDICTYVCTQTHYIHIHLKTQIQKLFIILAPFKMGLGCSYIVKDYFRNNRDKYHGNQHNDNIDLVVDTIPKKTIQSEHSGYYCTMTSKGIYARPSMNNQQSGEFRRKEKAVSYP